MHWFDILVIILYLAGVVAIGIACRGRKGTADEYFTAQGSFSGVLGTVLIGLSIAATFFSGISLVAYISSAYSNGAQIGLGVASLPLAWVVLHFWFLPRFLRKRWRHPYDIVEERFGYTVRAAMAVMFVLLRIGWMGVLIYAPTLIIMGTLQLDDRWFWPVILIFGLSSTAYTVIGGIRGVIVTDAIQFVVLFGGMLFIGGYILTQVGSTPAVVWDQLAGADRLAVLDFSFDLTESFTFWAVLIGMGFGNLGSYLSDPMALQRYLAADSPKEAARSFGINIVGAICISLTLVGIGLLLWVWYQAYPESAAGIEPDKIISHFIATELPVGLAGLMIAAILAATMSSMTSGINALAGSITNDWIERLGRKRSNEEMLKLGRRLSLGVGLFSTLVAGFVAKLGTILQASQVVLGSCLGPMLACMALAVIGWSVRPRDVMIGLVAGTVTGWLVAWSPISGLWVACFSFAVAFGYPALTVVLGKSSTDVSS